MPKAAVAARVAELLELVQLNGLDSRKPGQLSGGQKQRVALARALARRPKVLLLDEPLAALDRKLRGETRAELKEIQRKLGATFVIVTHDPEEAMTMAGRIGIMRNGRLVQTGPPREIYEQPRDRDVASLLGDVNIFEGIVSRAGGSGFTFDCPRLGQEIAAMGAARAGERVCVAVRPERVRAVMPGEAAAVNRIEGVVRDAAFRGSNALLRVAAGGALILAESGAPGRNFVREETVTLCFDPEAAAVLET